jgi:hypothetical protein
MLQSLYIYIFAVREENTAVLYLVNFTQSAQTNSFVWPMFQIVYGHCTQYPSAALLSSLFSNSSKNVDPFISHDDHILSKTLFMVALEDQRKCKKDSWGTYMRCKGIELNPSIAHISRLAHGIASRFRVLSIPMSSHLDFACALFTSFRVGLLMTCIVSAKN